MFLSLMLDNIPKSHVSWNLDANYVAIRELSYKYLQLKGLFHIFIVIFTFVNYTIK
jgi:hypothetical protein